MTTVALRGTRTSWRPHPVVVFLARRIVAGFLTLLVASMLIFFATQMLPGDPASLVLGRSAANPAAVHDLRLRLGLDRSVIHQYLSWLGTMLQGDLGDSVVGIAEGSDSAPISHIIAEPLGNSVVLALIAMALTIPLTIGLGVFTGLRSGRPVDHAITTVSLGLVALPEFALAALFVLLFFTVLGWFPPVALVAPGQSPLHDPSALVLPVLTLLVIGAAVGLRQVRAGVVEVMRQDYVFMARMHGIPERRVVRRYIVRNSMAASVQVITQNFQYLIGGIIIVEVVFAYPGIGSLLVNAVTARDYTEVQSISMLIGAFYVALNILADLIVVFLVPKLRTKEMS